MNEFTFEMSDILTEMTKTRMINLEIYIKCLNTINSA